MRLAVKISAALILTCVGAARAQVPFTGGGLPTPAIPTYTGPGDVVASASAFWGLRAYNVAYAAGLNKLANVCLPADSVCADATSDANGNLVLPGSLSTCANAVTICTVKTLYDQSGALACAAGTNCDVTQATIANRPTLVIPGAANGCPTTAGYCMAFVRANALRLASSNAITLSQPISLEFVGNRTGTTSNGQGALAFNSATQQIGWNAGTNAIRIGFGTFQTLAANDNTWHAVQGVASNTVGSLNADGAGSAANNGANAPAAATIVLGCQASAGTNCVDGVMTEAGIWPIAFSGANIAALNTNQHNYWGF